MAESAAVALGRYLRELRERKGLSLARVCEITQLSSEAMDKGALSRLERGQQAPSIFRLGPLARIYEITADALIERMELDREVDKLGGPDTDGKTYDQLHHAGAAAMSRTNKKWEAYAYFRDAWVKASAPKRYEAWVNLVTVIRSLGKNALALHELRQIEFAGGLDPDEQALIKERMARCSRCLGDLNQAVLYADAAIAQSRALGDRLVLAYALSTRAGIDVDREHWETATAYLVESLGAYRAGEGNKSLLMASPSFEAQTYLVLAECAVRLGSLGRARRLAAVARKLGQERQLPLCLAGVELALGWIDDAEGRAEQAVLRWRKASAMAARIDFQRVVFSAEVEIFRKAQELGESSLARASKRRLERLAPWIPRHIPAFTLYRKLIDEDARHSRANKGERHADVSSISGSGISDVRDFGGNRGIGSSAAKPRRHRVAPGG